MTERPKIDYPCPWSFRLLGLGEAEICAAVTDVLKGRPFTVTLSKQSAKGTYQSMALEVEVVSEVDRDALFAAFSGHPAIRYVL